MFALNDAGHPAARFFPVPVDDRGEDEPGDTPREPEPLNLLVGSGRVPQLPASTVKRRPPQALSKVAGV